MEATVSSTELRGVYCRFCGKAIRLSASFIKRETAIRQDEQNPLQELSSRVFPARCRNCREEAIYTLSQIYDFADEETSEDVIATRHTHL
jgi:hypothetical protein